MNKFDRIAKSLSLSAASLTLCTFARAQDPGSNVPTPPPAPTPPVLTVQSATPDPLTTAPVTPITSEPVIDASTSRKTLPNKPLLLTGTLLLGATYAASAVVAATSDRTADDKLYYPVAGPWLDLNHRGCSAVACEHNTRDRALLVGDGILQGVGALGMLLSLMIPEKTTRSWYLIGNREVVVVPSLASSMTGLSAVGTF